MGTFSLENQGTYSFLVYEFSPDDVMDTLCLGMITHNSIPGISQAVFTQMDEKKYIKYNISAKVPLDQFLLGTVNRKRLLGVFSSLASAFLSADDYMIDMNTLLLDTQYMYADVRTNSTVLICLPVSQSVKQPLDLRKFFKNIMFTTQFDQNENCDYIAQILNDLNGSSQFSIVDFKKMIDKLSEKSTVSAGAATVNQTAAPHDPERTVSAAAPASVTPPSVDVRPVVSQPIPTPPKSQKAPAVPQKAPAVPQKAPIPMAPAPARVPQGPKQPEISLFYLLQHYNKDNAEVYKQQKEEKKAEKAGGKPAVPSKQPAQKPPKAQQARSAVYAVPGMQNPPAPAANPPQQKVIPNAKALAGAPSGSASAAMPLYIPNQEMQQKPASFGETTVLGAASNDGETTLLSEAAPAASMSWLIRIKTNERIPIRKDVFRIGKNNGSVDYFVADNAAVSRNHADILFRDGKYYIQDNNSTNHTYLNGKLIPGNTPSELKDGYSVSLANELFRFEQ